MPHAPRIRERRRPRILANPRTSPHRESPPRRALGGFLRPDGFTRLPPAPLDAPAPRIFSSSVPRLSARAAVRDGRSDPRVYQYGAVLIDPAKSGATFADSFPKAGVDESFRRNGLWNELVGTDRKSREEWEAARRAAASKKREVFLRLDGYIDTLAPMILRKERNRLFNPERSEGHGAFGNRR